MNHRHLVGVWALGSCLLTGCGSDLAKGEPDAAGSSSAGGGTHVSDPGDERGEGGASGGGKPGVSPSGGARSTKAGKGIVTLTLKAQ